MFLPENKNNATRQRLDRWAQIRRVGKSRYVITRAAAWGGVGIAGNLLIGLFLGPAFRLVGIVVFAVIAPLTALLSWWGRETEYTMNRRAGRRNVPTKD
jgi:fatty acid desaturase